jgi:RNA polymerase sigma-70 factor, ECF subfamily
VPQSPAERLAQLFAESRASLRQYVRRWIRSPAQAEEIVQEAYLRTLERGAAVETPRGFLFSTAHNLAANARRHERIAKTDLVGDLMGDSDESRVYIEYEPSAEEVLLAQEERRLLQEAIDHLPPQCRSAFALKAFHGCSYREIADRLQISVRTVEKHIARGMRETFEYVTERFRDDPHNE